MTLSGSAQQALRVACCDQNAADEITDKISKGGGVSTSVANTFTAAPQTIAVDDDAHAGLVVTPHSATQTAPLVKLGVEPGTFLNFPASLVISSDSYLAGGSVQFYGGDTTGGGFGAGITAYMRSEGTVASPTPLQGGDDIIHFDALAWNGTTYAYGGEYTITCKGDPVGGRVPTYQYWLATGADGVDQYLYFGIDGTNQPTMSLRKTGWVGISITDDSRLVVVNTSDGTLLPLACSALGVNTTGANAASAVLEIDSTTKGFLPPRMSTTQRNAISSPAEGLVIYNLTTHKLDVYNGTAWVEVTAS